MTQIRYEIDNLDRKIIATLGERFKYVKAAAKFKTSESSVCAPQRFQSMLNDRRNWAINENLCPNAIEKMYYDLINHFIRQEMEKWQDEYSKNI